MRALGFDVKKAEVLKTLREYDPNGRGLIDFEDFNKVSKYRRIIILYIIISSK